MPPFPRIGEMTRASNKADEQKKILIIDDEPDIVVYLRLLLEDHNYVVVSAKEVVEFSHHMV